MNLRHWRTERIAREAEAYGCYASRMGARAEALDLGLDEKLWAAFAVDALEFIVGIVGIVWVWSD